MAPPMTGANAFPYMCGSKTCRQRLIGQSVLEAKRSFRRPKCREAPSWQCLPIPPVISQGFFWKSRSANVKIAAIRKLLRLQPITDGEERQQNDRERQPGGNRRSARLDLCPPAVRRR